MAAVSVGDVVALMEAWAPVHTADSWDNVGLQLGHPDQPVRRILVTMDVDAAVAAEAAARGADLLIAHHPAVFQPLRTLRADDPATAVLLDLVRAGTAVYAAHTNLDRAAGGVNDALAAALGLRDVEPLVEDPAVDRLDSRDGAPAMGRIGVLAAPLPLAQLAEQVRDRLDVPFVLRAGDDRRPCRCVAVCGGAGGGLISAALAAGADVYVTGDLKYHQVQTALAHGLALIDAGHYATERPVLRLVAERLAAALRDRGVEVAVAGAADRFRTPWTVV